MAISYYNVVMNKINLFITNASGNLAHHERMLRAAVDAAADFVFGNLRIDLTIDLVITDQVYDSTIPEDGVCGRTFSDSFIMFYVDPEIMTETKVYEMLVHELSHAARWHENPEFSRTLFDNLILEGLAMSFEEAAIEARGAGKEQTFCLTTLQNRGKQEYEKLYKKISPLFDKTNDKYNFQEIFISGDAELPRWAGYSLGYYLVKQFLAKTDKTIFQVNALPYQEFRKVLT